ncbi:MAG: hypothetical protein RKP20_14560 [Candidatus Competibacter sp.]|nr:hypothetical protein [Candidatus Competibacter sp.]
MRLGIILLCSLLRTGRDATPARRAQDPADGLGLLELDPALPVRQAPRARALAMLPVGIA